MPTAPTTDLEKTSLEAHVDLCALRYANLDNRLSTVEGTLKEIHQDIKVGQTSVHADALVLYTASDYSAPAYLYLKNTDTTSSN